MSLAGAAVGAAETPFVHERADGRVTAEERPFGFLTDPSGPSAGITSAGYRFGLASGVGADRPLPATVGSAGVSNTFELGHGLTDHVSAFGAATMLESSAAVVHAGAKVLLTPDDSSFRMSISALGLYETASATRGVGLQLAAAQDLGRVRLGATVLAEKVFATSRDGIDAIAMLGASYRLPAGLRVGVEYVAQDLEELATAGAEGGARQAVGPTIALDLAGGRYQAVVSAAFGLTPNSPKALARVGLATSF
jgi:hypothetical protein